MVPHPWLANVRLAQPPHSSLPLDADAAVHDERDAGHRDDPAVGVDRDAADAAPLGDDDLDRAVSDGLAPGEGPEVPVGERRRVGLDEDVRLAAGM